MGIKAVPEAAKKKRSKRQKEAPPRSLETTLWAAADKLRGHMDAAEYKHVVLGLIFLKYISDAFEEHQNKLKEEIANPESELYLGHVGQSVSLPTEEEIATMLEDRDAYSMANIFWVPQEARWSHLRAIAKQPTIGKILDDAMVAIERDNPTLKGVLPKDYARPALDKQRLGEIIDLIGTIGLGDKANQSRDMLGRVYEYFLGQFASAEGKKGGQFYTARCVVQLLVEMLAPYKGRIFDPCCGSGGMFVQSEKFVEAHGGRIGDISIFGQESNPTTWKLAKMNLAIRGIENNLGPENADSFHRDLHKDLKGDYILANPPFNDSDWSGERLREDVRWKYGVPPVGNANFAWVQHFIHHLAPTGLAGFVLANGSMSSNQSGEGEIRKAIIEADLVDCMVALPGQLFYNTQIPVCLWFIARDKRNHRFRDRRGETLFIDARKMGTMIDRVHRELTVEDIEKIANTYHAWRGDAAVSEYADVAGFCKSAKLDEIRAHEHLLTPGRYVGAEDIEDDGEPFDQKIARLTAKLNHQFEESAQLEIAIKQNLAQLAMLPADPNTDDSNGLENSFEGLVGMLMQVRRDEQPKPSGDYMRFLVATVLNYRLEIRTKEAGHNYPHFHVTCPNGEASFRIDNQERLAGEIPRKHEREIQRWARQNHKLLQSEWERSRPVVITREHSVIG